MTELDPVLEAVVGRIEAKIDHSNELHARDFAAMADKVEASKNHADQLVNVITSDLRHVQSTVAKLEVAVAQSAQDLTLKISETSARIEKRLDDHVTSSNPHPALEEWLRKRHDGLAEIVEQMRQTLAEQKGGREAMSPLRALGWAVVTAVVLALASGLVAAAVAFFPSS